MSQIVHNISELNAGKNEFVDGMDLRKLSLVGISNLSNSLLETQTKSIDALPTHEEKSCYFYSFFTKKTASKADFAQQLAFELEETFAEKSDELRKALPTYLVNAIEYVAGE